MSQINSVGRRKAAVARVFVKTGSGNIVVNNKDYKNYFPLEFHQLALTEPLRILEVADKYDIKVNVKGGGMKGQAEAVRLAIARALVKEADEQGRTIEVEQDGQQKPLNEVKHTLKTAKPDIMRRDARVVERKKPGFRKARKKAQFSKR